MGVRLDQVDAVVLGGHPVRVGRVVGQPDALVVGGRAQEGAEVLLRLVVRLREERAVVLVRLAVHRDEPRVDAPHEQQEGRLGRLVRGRAAVVHEAVLPAAVDARADLLVVSGRARILGLGAGVGNPGSGSGSGSGSGAGSGSGSGLGSVTPERTLGGEKQKR